MFNTVKLTQHAAMQGRQIAVFLFTLFFITACNKQVSQTDQTDIRDNSQTTLTMLKQAAKHVGIKVGIENNFSTNDCPPELETCSIMIMNITLAQEMPADWKIIFSNLAPVQRSISEYFDVKHLNGDLHQITSKGTPLASSETYSIRLVINTPLISESVLFPNYMLVDAAGNSEVILSTTEQILDGSQIERPLHALAFSQAQQQLRTVGDKVVIQDPTLRFFRDQELSVKDLIAANDKLETRIIPKVLSNDWSGARISLNKGLALPATLNDLGAALKRLSTNGIKLSDQGFPVVYELAPNLAAEAYELEIRFDGIELKAANKSGAFYGLISLAQLYDLQSNTLPIGKVSDEPAMDFRGVHIDVSRNFRSMAFMLRLLDQMAYYKLNKLHLHLADDEGWRLEIESLPELTDVGAYRCWDNSEMSCLSPQLAAGSQRDNPNNGYYSKAEYITLLQAAEARNIEVIPSLDMPGHSRAAIVSMEARFNHFIMLEQPDEAREYLLTEFEDPSEFRSIQHYNDNTLNPCLPATYRFVSEVLTQLNTMHQAAEVPLKRYHIGADETAGAWTDSPACLALIEDNESLTSVEQLGPYFIERVANQVADLNIMPAAWSDGLSHANPDALPAKVQANAWGTLYSGANNEIHGMVNKDWDVVLSLPDVLYFDFPYAADPIEPGYYWGSRYTNTYQVFQFMPFNLPAHAEIWEDKFGLPYASKDEVPLHENKKIAGIQAQLWSETVRSDEKAEYMLYPRLLAVAERAWHQSAWAEPYTQGTNYDASTNHIDASQLTLMKTDWAHFTSVLVHKAMPQLVADGIMVRVPLPGGKIVDGKLQMSSAFHGLTLEFRGMQGDWTVYQAPVSIIGPVEIRATIPSTNIYSRYQTIEQEERE
jgi:hexosaminidase